MKKAQQLDADGILEGQKEFEFSFRDFERQAETLKGHFGEIRYLLAQRIFSLCKILDVI